MVIEMETNEKIPVTKKDTEMHFSKCAHRYVNSRVHDRGYSLEKMIDLLHEFRQFPFNRQVKLEKTHIP